MTSPYRKRVLLVEPYADTNEMLALLLERLGHAVDSVGDARQALAAAHASPPNIVFTELVMPEMNGLDLCIRLRALPAMRDCRIIALSGYCLSSRMHELESAGFNGFLVKPASLETLMEMLAD